MPAGPTTGVRARRNRATRAAIMRAAAELTLGDGYEAATLVRIAERAGLAPRTVSKWFPLKEDMFFGFLPALRERLQRHLAAGDGDLVDRLRAWILEQGSRTAEDDDGEREDVELTLLQIRAIHRSPDLRGRETALMEPIRRDLAAAAAAELGGTADDPGPRAFAAAALGVLADLRAQASAPPGERAPVSLDAMVALLRGGLAALRET